jgi:hypothetical protein
MVDDCLIDETLSQHTEYASLFVQLACISEIDSGPAKALDSGFKIALAYSIFVKGNV